jgi:hypothetical protein
MLTKNTEQIDGGGPAFPHKPMKWDNDESIYVPDSDFHGHGMSLRDYFAAKALSGLLAAPNGKFPNQLNRIDYAQNAYALADAMLVASRE